MKKKFISIFLCLLCIFIFTGCATNPGYEIRQNEDGSVTETIFVPYSPSELRTLGVEEESILKIQEKIFDQVQTYYTEHNNNFKLRLATDSSLSIADKEYLANAITYHIAKTDQSNTVLSANTYTNGIEFYVEYKSVVAFYYYKMNMYYPEMIEEVKKDDSVVEHSFFLDKKVSKSTNLYGTGDDPLAMQIQQSVTLMLKNETILSDEQIASLVPHEFVYSYATPSQKIYSDADVIFTKNGITYHQWTISDTNLSREITTWTLSPNRNVWYAIILGTGIMLAGILTIVAVIKEKSNKNKVQIIKD